MSDDPVVERLIAAQRSLNEHHAKRQEFIAHHGYPSPGSRRLRVRHWVQRRYWSVGMAWRTWVAQRIAPWLDD